MAKDSTRRSLRTLAHGVVAGALALPVLAAELPTPPGRIGEIVGSVVATCAIVTKIVNTLEDRGLLPAFLKAPTSPGANPVPDPGPDVIEQPTGDDAPAVPLTVSPA